MRSRVPAFVLAIVTTLFVTVGALAADDYYGCDGVFADAGIMPIISLGGYTVDVFYSSSSGTASSFYTDSSLSPGQMRVYRDANTRTSVNWGYVVTIPANSRSGYLDILGLFPVTCQNSSSVGWLNVNPSSSTPIYYPVSYFLSTVKSYVSYNVWSTGYGPTPTFLANAYSPHVYVPAHTNTLYLFVFSTDGGTHNFTSGAYYTSNASISFTPDPVDSSSTLSSILTAINNVNTSVKSTTTAVNGTTQAVNGTTQSVKDLLSDQQNAPARKAEDSFIGKFGGQIEQVEDALSSFNPALPNGGDIGGFTSDLSDGLGLSGSSFSVSDLNDAAAGFSGPEATGVGGPWEFFTQTVVDDLSGDFVSMFDVDALDPILVWFERAEGRYGVWSSP